MTDVKAVYELGLACAISVTFLFLLGGAGLKIIRFLYVRVSPLLQLSRRCLRKSPAKKGAEHVPVAPRNKVVVAR